jgi:hypothetical protein
MPTATPITDTTLPIPNDQALVLIDLQSPIAFAAMQLFRPDEEIERPDRGHG